MKYVKFFFLTACFLLCISAVSASDNETFADLQEIIDSDESGTINLQTDYIHDLQDKVITINKSLTVNGNGHVIDANGSDKVFSITGDNVILNNLTILNSYASANNVNIIEWSGVNGKLSNTIITNNTISSSSMRSNILFWNATGGEITDSVLSNNTVSGSFAQLVFYNTTDGVIDNTTFENNKLLSTVIFGMSLGPIVGPLYWTGDNGRLLNSKFTDNTGIWGGSLYWTGKNGNVYNSTFINNTAFYSGGAIYWTGLNGTVSKSYFFSNNASGGSAVYWYSQDDKGNISSSLFVNNPKTIYVGTSTTLNISNSMFVNTLDNSSFINATNGYAIAKQNWWGYGEAQVSLNAVTDSELYLNITCPENVTVGENTAIIFNLSAEGDLPEFNFDVTDADNAAVSSNTIIFRDGLGEIEFSPLHTGTVSLTANFLGYDFKFSLTADSQSLMLNAENIYEGENATIIITAGKNTTENVSITLNNKTYSIKLNNGSYNLTVENLTVGVYFVNATYGEDYANTTFSVLKRSTYVLSASDLVKYYSHPEMFVVNLTDGGVPVANAAINITVNNVNYSRITDENGSASLAVNLASGNYTVISSYMDCTIENSITVLSTISAEDLTGYYGEILFNVSILNASDNVNVTFNINGIIYSNLTDSNGTAYLDIKLDAGNYIITSTNPLTGENKANNITILPTGNYTIYVSEEIIFGEAIVVTSDVDLTGNFTLFINNETFSGEISNGSAVFNNISLIPATYDAVIIYGGNNNYNAKNITSKLTVLKIEDYDIIYSDELYSDEDLTVTLPDNAGGNVTVNINKTNYTFEITNQNITFSMINFTEGIYNLSINYSGDDIYAPKTVNSTLTIKPDIILLEASNITKYYKGSERFIVTLVKNGNLFANATVNITINGVTYKRVTNATGSASIAINLNSGNYIVTTSYANYSIENTINVISTVYADDLIRYYKDNSLFKVMILNTSGNPAANLNVTFNIGGVIYSNTTDVNGVAYLDVDLKAGGYIITSTNPINGENRAKIITVLPTDNYNITLPSEIEMLADIYVKLPDDANGNLSVIIGGENYTCDVINGSAAFNTTLTPDTYNITLSYDGDNNYAFKSVKTNITVTRIYNFNITVSEEIPFDGNLTVDLPADAGGNISVGVNESNFTCELVNASANISLYDFKSGRYNVGVTYYGNDKYAPKTLNSTLIIAEEIPILTAFNLSKYYKGSERFTVNLTDSRLNPLVNESVNITVNGVTYTRKTNENGTVSMAVNLNSGVYEVVAGYRNVSSTATITVNATVNGSDVVKIFRNETQYYATFRDSEGNYLVNGSEVRFNINGVFYTRLISGDEGLARLNLNLEQGEYILTAINPVTGENAANNITVIPLIVENKDLVKYYKNDSHYVVKIISPGGEAVGAGVNVTFNINGVFYTRTTNSTGHVQLKINLHPGGYIITCEYGDCKISNIIQVRSVLSADNLIMNYSDGSKFVAKLVDGTGNPKANTNITFNINGVFYERITNESGIASLNINLQKGEYIITSSYNGANIANKVTVN